MTGKAMRLVVGIVLTVMAVAASVDGALAAEKRVALVVRNATYQDGPELAAAAANAAAMTVALRVAGFDVTVASDVDHRTLTTTMAEFQRRLATADLGFFYYSGLMLGIGGQSFLLPVDARLRYEFDVVFETVELEQVLRQIRDASHKAVVVIDTMMPNPAVARLAAAMGEAAGTVKPAPARPPETANLLTAYSHQPGAAPPPVAGRTAGPYAVALAKEIARPGAELRAALKATADAVAAQTGGVQQPWFADKLPGGDIVLVPAAPATAAAPPPVARPVATESPATESPATESPAALAPSPTPVVAIPPPPAPKPAVIAAAPPPVPAEEPVRAAALPAPRPPDPVAGRFAVGRVYTTIGPAALLATPSPGAAPVRNLERGAPLTVLETAENPSWVHVRDIFYNEGYIAARSLTPDGDLAPAVARAEPPRAETPRIEPPKAEPARAEPPKPKPEEPDRQVAMLPGAAMDAREAAAAAPSAAWPPHIRQAVAAAEDAARRGGTGGSGAARRALSAAERAQQAQARAEAAAASSRGGTGAANGDQYQGEPFGQGLSGVGVYRFANGIRYAGEWRSTRMHGLGVIRFPGGDWYEGEFRDGRPQGVGVFHFADGILYAGELTGGKVTGVGQMRFPNGDIYVGTLTDGRMNGTGRLAYGSGASFVGSFRDGQVDGPGVRTFDQGESKLVIPGVWRGSTTVSN